VHVFSIEEGSSIKAIIEKEPKEDFPFVLGKRFPEPAKGRMRVMLSNKVKVCIMGRKGSVSIIVSPNVTFICELQVLKESRQVKVLEIGFRG